MALFIKPRSNRKFKHKPRLYKSDKEGSPFKIENRFDQFRKVTGNDPGNLKQKFLAAMDDMKNNPNKSANRTVLVIAAILFLIFLFLIDFDLTIFLPNN